MLELPSRKGVYTMPNIKSAKKKVLVINRRKQENKYVKATIATMTKNFRATVKDDVAKAEVMLKDIISYIDSAKSKGVIHANNASRKIARLNILLDKAKKQNVEPAKEEKVEEKKAEVIEKVEKPIEKKTAAKKTAVKKEPAEKKATKAKATKKTAKAE